MSAVNRRTFVQLSSGAFLAAASRKLLSTTGPPTITHESGVVRVAATTYEDAPRPLAHLLQPHE